jgi:hypothetical protein
MKPATQPVTHTPGPWREYERSGLWTYIKSESGVLVGGAYHDSLLMDDLEESDANARLISSAPELLEALKEAKELIQFFHGDPAWEIYDSSSPEMKRLNAAIAKATGAEGTRP